MRYKANLPPRALLTITYFKACMKITKAVTVTLLAAECQALLAVVQRSVLTQFDSLIPLQKGLLIFPKTVPDCCQKLAKFSSLFLFLCSPRGPFNLSHILLIDPSFLQCAAESQNSLCPFVQRSFLAYSCSVYVKAPGHRGCLSSFGQTYSSHVRHKGRIYYYYFYYYEHDNSESWMFIAGGSHGHCDTATLNSGVFTSLRFFASEKWHYKHIILWL